MHRRQCTRAQAGEHNHAEHEQHHAIIELEGDPEWRRVHGQRPREPAHAEDAQHDPDAATEDGKDEHFRQVLPHDPMAPGAERHAHGNLPPPQRRPGDEQVRYVNARDEQHADAGAEHRIQQRVNFRTENGFRIRHHVGADTVSSCDAIVVTCARAWERLTSGFSRAMTR